jgi:hypothetical protein
MLDRRKERKLDRLLRDDHIRGILSTRLAALQQTVRVGLKPKPFGRSRQLPFKIRGGASIKRKHSTRPLRQRIQTRVRRDPVQPGPKRGPPLEALAPPPRPQERLLNQILGLLQRADHPVTMEL